MSKIETMLCNGEVRKSKEKSNQETWERGKYSSWSPTCWGNNNNEFQKSNNSIQVQKVPNSKNKEWRYKCKKFQIVKSKKVIKVWRYKKYQKHSTAAKLVRKQQWWDPPLEIPSLGSVLVQPWQISFGLARQINNSGHFMNCSLLVTLKRQVYLFGVFRLEPLLHFCLWHKSFCTNLTRCFHTKSSSNKRRRRRRRRRRRNWSLLESCWPRVSPPHTCTLQSNAMESNVDHTELTPRLSNYYLKVVNSRPSSQLHWAHQQGTRTACMHWACSYPLTRIPNSSVRHAKCVRHKKAGLPRTVVPEGRGILSTFRPRTVGTASLNRSG